MCKETPPKLNEQVAYRDGDTLQIHKSSAIPGAVAWAVNHARREPTVGAALQERQEVLEKELARIHALRFALPGDVLNKPVSFLNIHNYL